MTVEQKRKLDRWLPTLIQIGVILVSVGFTYGQLSTSIRAVKEQNAALWKEVYYLRQRIDGRTSSPTPAGSQDVVFVEDSRL